ncbi:MAG: shikimate dehydrogenase [Pseudorhodoplanes sp.]
MTEAKPFRLAGILGWPVSHSRSPKLHGYWLERYGIPGAYLPLGVPPDNLKDALKGLLALGFAGCNVTIPHKEKVMPLMHHLDPVARKIGAVNLIVIENGRLNGFNTDAYGFVESLRQSRPGWDAAAGPAVVLGAGGASRAVIVGLAEQGAREIRLLNRTESRAQKLAALGGSVVRVMPWEDRAAALEGAALLVNTTDRGMVGQSPLDLALDRLPASALVSDLVYNPLETPLLAAAKRRGNPTVDGLGMLLHQARPAFQAWFGILPEITPELRATIEATIPG